MIASWRERLEVGDFPSLARTQREITRRERFRGQGVCHLKNFQRYRILGSDSFSYDLSMPLILASEDWQEPMLKHLLQHPTPFDALALDFYRIGFFVLVTSRRTDCDETFAAFAREILLNRKSSPFCMLSMLEGHDCDECPIEKENLFKSSFQSESPRKSEVRLPLFSRCWASEQYVKIKDGVVALELALQRRSASLLGAKIRESRIILELKKLEKALFSKKIYEIGGNEWQQK